MALLICAAAAVVELCLVAASGEHAIPAVLSSALIAALGVVQIVCALLIWRIFTGTRRRFLQRIRAATGNLDDRIFLADVQTTTLSILTEAGWMLEPMSQWSDSIHPDDRARWPASGATESQRVEIRLRDANGEWRWHRLRATPLEDESGRVREWVGSLHDIHEQKLASEHRELVIAELRHRLKNLITVIDALAKNSRRADMDEPGVDSFLQRYLGRLHALGAAGDIVLASSRDSIEARALIQTTLEPFMSENLQRIQIAGPALQLSEELGAGLGLAVHELATNALKYGALSVPEGSVSFTWTATQNGAGREIVFRWDEKGGPPPSPPLKSGFGIRMIKHVASREKAGRVDIDYPPEGLSCRIAFNLDDAARADSR